MAALGITSRKEPGASLTAQRVMLIGVVLTKEQWSRAAEILTLLFRAKPAEKINVREIRPPGHSFRMTGRAAVVMLLCALFAPALRARRITAPPGRSAAAATRGEKRDQARGHHSPEWCSTCARDSRGRILRSRTVRREFQRQHPCPSNGATSGPCPGYIADHIIPLRRGGPDAIENMQWQQREEAAAKDRAE